MTQDPILHHASKRIVPGSLERSIEVFEILGCKVTYRPEKGDWAMLGQDSLSFDLQLVETDSLSIPKGRKAESHVGFTSRNPQGDIDKVRQWAEVQGFQFEEGQWSEKELWFDLPEIFGDFVIEIMYKSIDEA